jgi:GDPmannose 4,6-dehydratase
MNNKQISLITGISGQTGSFLAELLLEKGHEVHGIIRRSSSFNTQRIDHIFNKLHLYYGDISDPLSVDEIIFNVRPNYIFSLAAQSHVKVSFDVPYYTGQVDALGTLNMLEATRKHCPKAKFYNAATSELFGINDGKLQNENTPFYPRSPYGCAKLYAISICRNYRESYNMFIVNGILFNHESERRGSTFATKKITEGLAKYLKTGTPFYLGNLNALRDWGYAKNFVEGIWLMMQQDKPDDYILCTGETHSIKDFINECLLYIPNKENYIWKKDSENKDILWNAQNDNLVIGIDPKYYRPSEVNYLKGDYSKAKEILGWEPTIKFKELVKIMMEHELKNL